MGNLSNRLLTASGLLAICLCLQSCTEQGAQLEKEKVQFSLNPASAYGQSVSEIELPENVRARISVASSNGDFILLDHEIEIFKRGDVYVTDQVELTPGRYLITDFIIVKDGEGLYVTPKKGAELTASITHALPLSFSVAENNTATVQMRVMEVRNEDLQKFGYASAKAKGNTLSIAVYENNASITSATAELRQNKTLLEIFSLTAVVNTISLAGNPKVPYTLTVYKANLAKTITFDIKQLKKEIGKNPLQIALEPALVLTIESSVDESNEYEEYFEFRMDGIGAVNINWGDGEQSAATLPFEVSHEYIIGHYTAIVTGNIDQVTDFSGFSYGSIISAITGLTNLTSLKVYDPSWGAVPIKVDLSNCMQLERINIAKYGAPYETVDLRTDFRLPTEHYINTFILDAPSFDVTRAYISAEELEVMVDNIYNNVINRNIYNGLFLVNPVDTPAPATQQKIDVLRDQYNWLVAFNDEIYGTSNFEMGRSRSTTGPDVRREQWLRERFSDSERIIERAKAVSSVN